MEYGGCKSVLEGPVCVLGAGRGISIWIEGETDELFSIEVDGDSLSVLPTPVQLGRRYDLDLEENDRQLVVRQGSKIWKLAIHPPDEPAWRAAATPLFAKHKFGEARLLVEEALGGPAEERGRALSVLARLESWGGQPERSRELLEEAIADHRARGRVLDAYRDAFHLANLLFAEKNDLASARRVLATVPRNQDLPAEAACDLAYNKGLLAIRAGDLRTGLRSLTDAARRAERFGLTRKQLISSQILVPQLWRAGRRQEATDLIARMDDLTEGSSVCERARFLNNTLGWTSLLALEAGEAAPDPTPVLEQVLETYKSQCPQVDPFNVRINLALAHLHAGRSNVVAELLTDIGQLGPVPQLRYMLWILEIEARLALAEGQAASALNAYERLENLATAGLSPDFRWRGALGRARALASQERPDKALSALAEAERQLDQGSQLVPLIDQARSSYVAQREEGIRFYLELLLSSGNEAEAFAVARRSRARVVRGLFRNERITRLPPEEQRRWDQMISAYRARRGSLDASVAGDWRLAKDQLARIQAEREAKRRELSLTLDDALALVDRSADGTLQVPPPRVGELLLLYHPLPEGWIGFAHDGTRLTTARLACDPATTLPLEELSRCLLGPFENTIRRAPQLRFLPHGPLRQLDFHTLTMGGEELIAQRPVVYGLDLPAPPPGPLADPARALVVADPGGDLPAARQEADAVARALAGHTPPWEIEQLRGQDADGPAVRDGLAKTDLLHYTGHATFGGLGGWESALPLAHGSRLTLGDILTLPSVPRWVVLSGCETGRVSSEGTAETVSLAHAFLVTGTSGVIAAVRPVVDREAALLLTTFYREWSSGKSPTVALREAQLHLRREMPSADWSAFRVIEI